MVELLKLIDALRERGAIKISTPEVSVEFAAPPAAPIVVEEPEAVIQSPPMSAAELERLLYAETTKM
jgi:hypothetical protein